MLRLSTSLRCAIAAPVLMVSSPALAQTPNTGDTKSGRCTGEYNPNTSLAAAASQPRPNSMKLNPSVSREQGMYGGALGAPKLKSQTGQLDRASSEYLAAHNAARAKVAAAPLRWNSMLAANAACYAEELARTHQLVHAPREGRGTERENLLSVPIGYSPDQMMKLWTDESRHLVAGLFPNVSDTGDWSDVAHYTQMIWPTTTDLGCGSAMGGGFNWLVCRYNPGGNKDGKPVIATVMSAQRSRDAMEELDELMRHAVPLTKPFMSPGGESLPEASVESLEKDARRARAIADAANEAGDFSDLRTEANKVATAIEKWRDQAKAWRAAETSAQRPRHAMEELDELMKHAVPLTKPFMSPGGESVTEATVESLEKDARRARAIADAANEAGDFSDLRTEANKVATAIEKWRDQAKAWRAAEEARANAKGSVAAAVTPDGKTSVEQPQLPSQETFKPEAPAKLEDPL